MVHAPTNAPCCLRPAKAYSFSAHAAPRVALKPHDNLYTLTLPSPTAPYPCPPTAAALPAFCDGKLYTISGAAGSSKLDQLDSLDISALSGSYAFGERMRSEVVGLLQGLEVWAEKQAAGMELAAQPDTLASQFESLLRVRWAGVRDKWGASACCASDQGRICEHAGHTA